MSEVLHSYEHAITGRDGKEYRGRACGRPRGAMWEGWIEFIPIGGGAALRTPRETTQPNHTDLEYWATGLTAIYLEGALSRVPELAVEKRVVGVIGESELPSFDEPAPAVHPVVPVVEVAIDPFAGFMKGEELLRKQLYAMKDWQLRRVIEAYAFADAGSEPISRMSRAELAELIITAVRDRLSGAHDGAR